jgi:hypothetical protein
MAKDYEFKQIQYWIYFHIACPKLRMCSVLEPGRTECNGSIPRAWNGSDPVFGSEKFEERNGSIPVFGFGMG